jgi:hypothetical protein
MRACQPPPKATAPKEDPNQKYMCGGTKAKPKYCTKEEMEKMAEMVIQKVNQPVPAWQQPKKSSSNSDSP